MTPKEAYDIFQKLIRSHYDFEDLSKEMRDSLVDLHRYIIERKGDLPELFTKQYYDRNYLRNILIYSLKNHTERAIPVFFSIEYRSSDIVRDIITSDCFEKIIPYVPKYQEKFTSILKEIKEVIRKHTDYNIRANTYFSILKDLAKQYPENYKAELINFSKQYLLSFEYSSHYQNSDSYGRWNEPERFLSEDCILILKKELSNEEYDKFFKAFPFEAPDISLRSISYIAEYFGKDAMPYLANIFKSKHIDDTSEHAKTIVETLSPLDWYAYAEEIWNYAVKLNLKNQFIIAKLLAKDENAMNYIKSFIKAKGGKATLAYFSLVNIETAEARAFFETNFHQEKNDKKVRQIIMPMAQNYFYKKALSLEEVNAIITKAEERGALKWNEQFKEEDLPDLYLKNGDKLTGNQIRFLFYRMSFITEMKSDPEAKLLLNFIDREKSNEFAGYILKDYLDRGSVAKEKYVMCLAGLLGNDDLLADLQKVFKTVFDAKRMKMTQYVIGTMALIGSDKALRFIEYVSRKYKRKEALHNTAVEALEIAAEELGIDIYELSDRIIPDFGFDGLYKTIQVGEEEMRVFVAGDFKLQYITEDNKIRKSLPKVASKELKDELKVIQREIREVNRAQKEKLEQYMVLERRWSFEDWQKFYLLNPVIFNYASTLVWGVFDEHNQLKNLFYVDQDSSLLDIEDDEIEIDDDRLKIGMIHNLRISEAQKKNWIDKFYELEITQPFEQLLRKSFVLDSADKEKTRITKYEKMPAAKGGRAVQGYFEKRGWRKEVADAGCFDFSKSFDKENIYAFLNLEGLCIGYYEEEVVFHNITFHKIGESSWSEETHIKLKDVPPIVYSEVIADMEGIIKREETAE